MRRTLLLAGLLLATSLGLGWFTRPYRLARDQQADLARLQSRLRALRQEHASLSWQAAQLATPEGRVRQVRRQGWVRKGERRLLFLEPSPERHQ